MDQIEIVNSYLESFRNRDLIVCVEYYDADAVLHFMNGVYRGKKGIEQWHRDRFDADMEIIKVQDISTNDDTVTIKGLITSKKLRAFRIKRLGGKAIFQFQGGRIKEARFEGQIGASTQIEWRRM